MFHTYHYVKACNCRDGTTATCGKVTFNDDQNPTMAVFHPGPVCDTCDTPWKLKDVGPQTPPSTPTSRGVRGRRP